jgi:hypothetical protein
MSTLRIPTLSVKLVHRVQKLQRDDMHKSSSELSRLFGFVSVTLGFVALAACSSGEGRSNSIPPFGASDAGTPNDGGAKLDAAADSGSVPGSDAGDRLDAAVDATSDAGPRPLPGAACPVGSTWGAPVLEPFSTAQDDVNPALAGNSLTLVWSTGSGNPVIHYVDRAQETDPWGQEQMLVSTAAPLRAGERVAVTDDGLQLYGIAADGRSIVQLTRESVLGEFGPSSGGSVSNLNMALAAFAADEQVADLVLGASGLSLLYRRVSSTAPGLFLSLRLLTSDMWPVAMPFAKQAELLPSGGKVRRPTGLSRDLRALFYWDEVTSTERVGMFAFDAPVATVFEDLGARRGAAPNGACSRLYFSTSGATSLDIFGAPRL